MSLKSLAGAGCRKFVDGTAMMSGNRGYNNYRRGSYRGSGRGRGGYFRGGNRNDGNFETYRRTFPNKSDQQEQHHERRQRGGRDSDWEEGEGRRGGGKFSRPPHLRGRDIGLFYAARSRGAKQRRDREERPLIQLNREDERKLDQLVREMDSVFHTSQHLHEARRLKSEKKRKEAERTASNFSAPPPSSSGRGWGEGSTPRASAASSSTFEHENRSSSRSESEDGGEWREEDEEYPGIREEADPADENLDDLAVEDLVVQGGLAGGVTEDPFFRTESLSPDDGMEKRLRADWEVKLRDPAFQRMQKVRQKLPMSSAKQQFSAMLHNNQVCVISGETGCGKSTQVPQMILEDSLSNGTASTTYIVVTQPRRISATSLAHRVRQERAESRLGESVGYQIRLEARRPRDRGGILYCTNGILLRWLLGDGSLRRISHILLDEIHERDIYSDFLLVIVRDLLRTRKDLKVVLMSATLNARMFSEYFNVCPVLEVPGRLHKVTPHFLEEILDVTNYSPQNHNAKRRIPFSIQSLPFSSKEKMKIAQRYWEEMSEYANSLIGIRKPRTLDFLRFSYDEDLIDLELILSLSHCIVSGSPPDEAILIFLPGWMDISKLFRLFLEDREFGRGDRYWIVPLHSLLPNLDQRKVFERPRSGCRKIVIATNIAETSITVEDVVHVIDCGKIKMTTFDVESNIQTLRAEWVSQANAEQRRGRAGRVREGHCYHLFTQWRYNKLDRFMLPEMLRTRLDSLCLQIKLMGLGDIRGFLGKAPQPPTPPSLKLAIDELCAIGALDEEEDLTPLGWHIAKLPVDPHCGKMILFGAMFSCLDPVLTIASCLDYKDPFHTPMFKEKEVDAAKRDIVKDFHFNSDHLLWAEAFNQYAEKGESWARAHFLNIGTMKLIEKMKGQFLSMLKDLGFVRASPGPNKNEKNYGVVAGVVCAGLYPRIAESNPGAKRVLKYRNKNLRGIYSHPKSVNAEAKKIATRFVAYHQLVRSTQLFLNDSGMVSPYSLILFGGNLKFEKDGREETIILDDWIKFHCSQKTADLFLGVRRELDAVLERRINSPRPLGDGGLEDTFLDTLVQCLDDEDVSFLS